MTQKTSEGATNAPTIKQLQGKLDDSFCLEILQQLHKKEI